MLFRLFQRCHSLSNANPRTAQAWPLVSLRTPSPPGAWDAEYVEYEAMLRSLLPPTLRGKLDQMNKASREQISHEVGGLLGHGNDHTISAYYGSFRVQQKGVGRGERIGGIIVNAETDTLAQIYINPCPVADKHGNYRVYSDTERSALSISVVLEAHQGATQDYGVAEFVKLHPELSVKIYAKLRGVGLVMA